jgi:hypothetical protein
VPVLLDHVADLGRRLEARLDEVVARVGELPELREMLARLDARLGALEAAHRALATTPAPGEPGPKIEDVLAAVKDERAAAARQAAEERQRIEGVLVAANHWFVGVRDAINRRLDALSTPPPDGGELRAEVAAMGAAVLELQATVRRLAINLRPAPRRPPRGAATSN